MFRINRFSKIVGRLAILSLIIACETQSRENLSGNNPLHRDSKDSSVKQLMLKTEIPKHWVENMEEVRVNPLAVEYLSLREKGFETFPEEIFLCKNLKELDISMNPMESLPPEIGELKNLELLMIAYSPLKSLPPEIGALTNLQFLDLLDNELKTLPETIGKLEKLEFLNLSLNPIEDIPESISNLKKLKRLGLHGKEGELNPNLTSEDRERLEKLLPNCKITFD